MKSSGPRTKPRGTPIQTDKDYYSTQNIINFKRFRQIRTEKTYVTEKTEN